MFVSWFVVFRFERVDVVISTFSVAIRFIVIGIIKKQTSFRSYHQSVKTAEQQLRVNIRNLDSEHLEDENHWIRII